MPRCYVGHQRLDKALAAMPNVQAEKEWCAVGLRWKGKVERTHVAEVLMQPCWAAQSDMSCSPAWQLQPVVLQAAAMHAQRRWPPQSLAINPTCWLALLPAGTPTCWTGTRPPTVSLGSWKATVC